LQPARIGAAVGIANRNFDSKRLGYIGLDDIRLVEDACAGVLHLNFTGARIGDGRSLVSRGQPLDRQWNDLPTKAMPEGLGGLQAFKAPGPKLPLAQALRPASALGVVAGAMPRPIDIKSAAKATVWDGHPNDEWKFTWSNARELGLALPCGDYVFSRSVNIARPMPNLSA
jgi:hypothetical protein